MNKDTKIGLLAGIIFAVILTLLGLFSWWAYSWETHTLVWFIFVFGSLFGSIKINSKR